MKPTDTPPGAAGEARKPSPARATEARSDAEEAEKSAERVDELRPASSDEMFEVVRLNGVEELSRPTISLIFSGLAAGLAIGFSVVAEAAIRSRISSDAGWATLVGDMGYTVGFIIVVLGRLQLFTENTITPVLPICHAPTRRNFAALARNWSVVLTANIVGVSVFAAFLMWLPSIPEEMRKAVVELGRHSVDGGFFVTMTKGVGAGFLIAALVWVNANTRGASLAVVFVVTYVIALCEFSHVIAGTMEIASLVMVDSITLWQAVFGFFLPALIGNIIGGTVLFAFISYGQVYQEI
ncbi:MAG: formate/nitrite transporter family protein [Thalassobaculum sp.]